MVSDEYDLITIRIRKGDREILRNCFHPLKYNHVIRGLVSAVVDKIKAQGTQSAKIDEAAAEISLEEIEAASN